MLSITEPVDRQYWFALFLCCAFSHSVVRYGITRQERLMPVPVATLTVQDLTSMGAVGFPLWRGKLSSQRVVVGGFGAQMSIPSNLT